MIMTQHTEYPALDERWSEAVVLGLRARGADGRTIGDALATADAHCADSGEDVWEAFGDPEAYAAQVPLTAAEAQSVALPSLVRATVPVVLQLFGMNLVLATVDAYRTHTGTPLRLMMVLQVLAIVIVTAVIVRGLAWAGRHRVASAVGFGILAAAIVGIGFINGPVIARMPVWLGAALGLVLLIGPAVWEQTRGTDQTDPVQDPRTGAPKPAGTWLVRLTYWMVPAFTLIAAGIGLLLPR